MDPTQMLSRSEEAEQFLKQLSNKTRLMVLCSLLEGERSVTELLDNVPVTQPVLSQHLALLRDAIDHYAPLPLRNRSQPLFERRNLWQSRVHRRLKTLEDRLR